MTMDERARDILRRAGYGVKSEFILAVGERWREFDFTGPNEYVDSVIRELKDKCRPLLLVEPKFEWDWRAFPFELGRSTQEDEPPFKISLSPQMAEIWSKDMEKAAKTLCWTVAHEFYHIYAGIAERAWYDERAASRFAGDFSGVSAREYHELEDELLRPTAVEREYWHRWARELEPPQMPPELEEKYVKLYNKWRGRRMVDC